MRNFGFQTIKKPLLVFLAVLLVVTGAMTFVRAKAASIEDEPVFGEVETRLIDELDAYLDTNSPFYEAYKDSDRVNILLLGINDGMTDTIMVCSYDIENQLVDIISVPRDTYYYRPNVKSDGMFKINSVYHTSGKNEAGQSKDISAVAKAVSDTLLGLPIHYWVTISYQNIIDIIDAMGGVTFDVPQDMDYDDLNAKPELHIHIKAGTQLLDGENAVKVLRFRTGNNGTGYRKGDLGRIETQQGLVKAAIKQVVTGGKISAVLKAARTTLEGCSDIDWGFVEKVVSNITKLSGDSIHSYLMPNTLLSTPPYFVYPNVQEIAALIKQIYAIPEPVPETDGTTDTAQ